MGLAALPASTTGTRSHGVRAVPTCGQATSRFYFLVPLSIIAPLYLSRALHCESAVPAAHSPFGERR